MRRTTMIAPALLALGVMALRAQELPLGVRYGVFGGRSENIHTADFRALPGVPNCCPKFESGTGGGMTVGAQYEMPISASALFTIAASWADHSALLSAREPLAVSVKGKLQNGAFEHTVDATITSVGVEPGIGLRVASGLFLSGSVRIGAVLTSQYAQKEEIAAPFGVGTFLDALGGDSGQRTRNVNSGTLPDAQRIMLQAGAGLFYELPLNSRSTFLIVPGVSYNAGIIDVVRGTTWKANGVRVTLGVKYAPDGEKATYRDTLLLRDTSALPVAFGSKPRVRLAGRDTTTDRAEADVIDERTTIREHWVREVPRLHELTCSLTASSFDGKTEQPAAALRVEEFLRTTSHPLLGYIFFDAGSTRIPERYAQIGPADADAFRPEDLYAQDAVGVGRAILTIIGHNLRSYPKARLTITGCNSDEGDEKGNRTLSHERAESVKAYLVETWGIAPERLTVAARDLPAAPSSPRTPEGMEENRRVEITSDVPQVTDVFVAADTTRTSLPQTLRFRPAVHASVGISLWRLRMLQGTTVLKEFSGRGVPPVSLDWNIADDPRTAPRFDDQLRCELRIATSDGDECVAEVKLPTVVVTVEKKREEHVPDYTIQRYNLVLFPFGKSEVTSAQRRTTDLIRSRLAAGSQVTVEGYTDRTGDPQTNRRLAAGRAQATAAALGRSDAIVRGIGADRLLYENDTPEGRFYCRTVQVTVKTR